MEHIVGNVVWANTLWVNLKSELGIKQATVWMKIQTIAIILLSNNHSTYAPDTYLGKYMKKIKI